jgi:hypothetical protein
MSMRDHYRTRAAEFQARAAIECDAGARHEYENLARHYSSLAEQAGRNDFVDLIYEPRVHQSPWEQSCGPFVEAIRRLLRSLAKIV